MTAIEDKLAELRARFVERSAEEIVAIDRAIRDEDRDGLIERAHVIAGIAGLFGFAEIGEAAADLEDSGRAERDIDGPAMRLRALLSAIADD